VKLFDILHTLNRFIFFPGSTQIDQLEVKVDAVVDSFGKKKAERKNA
jgi:hypothetical protein